MNNLTKLNINWHKYVIFIPIQLISLGVSLKALNVLYEHIYFSFVIMSILLCIYLLYYFKSFIANSFLSIILPGFIYMTLEILRFGYLIF